MRLFKEHIFFYRGYAQAWFFLMLVLYTLFFPPSHHFEKYWPDTFMDVFAISCLLAGEFLRIWAVSHAGKCTRSRRLKAQMLVTTGPYAHIRNPIYVGNFLIALGIVFLSEVLIFIPVFLLLFALQYRAIVSEEENFLSNKFGIEFNNYRARVPKWFPSVIPIEYSFSFANKLPFNELGTVWGIVVGAFFFEWIESPLHLQSVIDLVSHLYHLLTVGVSL